LEEIPDDLFIPLLSLIRKPRFLERGRSPSDHQFHSLKPRLQLFLAHNQLRTLPPTLWSLDSVRVLSLRSNRLESLPGSIARLRNLAELNLGNNNLRWLPWELLKLLTPGSSLRLFSVKPNPFFRPFELGDLTGSQHSVWTVPKTIQEYDEALKKSRDADQLEKSTRSAFILKLIECLPVTRIAPRMRMIPPPPEAPRPLYLTHFITHVASGPASCLSLDGTVPRGVPTPPSKLSAEVKVLDADTNITNRANAKTRVPSLLELAIGAATSVETASNIMDILPTTTPTAVLNGLQEAANAVNEGGRTCSVCNRNYLIPRSEWIEFWQYMPELDYSSPVEDLFLPFLRRGCSHGCVE
jgi:hypothetical protein